MINTFKRSGDEVLGLNFNPASIMGYEPILIRDALLDFVSSHKDHDVILTSFGNSGMVATIGKVFTIVSPDELVININYNNIDDKTYNFIDINLVTGQIRTNVGPWRDDLLFLFKDICSILRIEN